MKFSVYQPPPGGGGQGSVLYYLAGLDLYGGNLSHQGACAGRRRRMGLMLIAPDTSPREPRIPGDAAMWISGRAPDSTWTRPSLHGRANYRMYSYVARELPAVVAANLPALDGATGIFGHSMGGHGALTSHCAIRRSTGQCRGVSHPSLRRCNALGVRKAFTNYLGPDKETWREHDATSSWDASPFPGIS